MRFKPLPIGIEDFGEMIQKGYYYVDKTLLIKELMEQQGKVTLFTRPRRFGKTLNLSMLQYFFESTGNEEKNNKHRELFQGLKIMDDTEKVENYMGKYPVISISLKSGKKPDFEMSYEALKNTIAREYERHISILDKLKLPYNREKFVKIVERKGDRDDYYESLRFLSQCLYEVYGAKTIILIDEYDVPLENAYFGGFYDEMIGFIRSLFESSLKTNSYLEFSVVTGCLRISKESIFTGLNNLKTVSILDEIYSEHFGFVQAEVDDMLEYYGCESRCMEMKKWYDGYQIGNTDVYNPWSVLNMVDTLKMNVNAFIKAQWANTSSNNIIHTLIQTANAATRTELEEILAGGTIEKPIHEEITYGDIDKNQDNLWNFLLFTGYLTPVSIRHDGIALHMTMRIPNTEIVYIYASEIMSWFDDIIRQKDLTPLYKAIDDANAESVEDEITSNLLQYISYNDYSESFYHGFLLGLLSNAEGYEIVSNRESGLGRPDLVIKKLSFKKPVVIMELKVVSSIDQLDKACDDALQQIKERRYEERYRTEGYRNFVYCGVAFFKKMCKVKMEE